MIVDADDDELRIRVEQRATPSDVDEQAGRESVGVVPAWEEVRAQQLGPPPTPPPRP